MFLRIHTSWSALTIEGETKGTHLLTDAVARKLFDIQEDGKTRIQVRFVTECKQTELRGNIAKGGLTI